MLPASSLGSRFAEVGAEAQLARSWLATVLLDGMALDYFHPPTIGARSLTHLAELLGGGPQGTSRG